MSMSIGCGLKWSQGENIEDGKIPGLSAPYSANMTTGSFTKASWYCEGIGIASPTQLTTYLLRRWVEMAGCGGVQVEVLEFRLYVVPVGPQKIGLEVCWEFNPIRSRELPFHERMSWYTTGHRGTRWLFVTTSAFLQVLMTQ